MLIRLNPFPRLPPWCSTTAMHSTAGESLPARNLILHSERDGASWRTAPSAVRIEAHLHPERGVRTIDCEAWGDAMSAYNTYAIDYEFGEKRRVALQLSECLSHAGALRETTVDATSAAKAKLGELDLRLMKAHPSLKTPQVVPLPTTSRETSTLCRGSSLACPRTRCTLRRALPSALTQELLPN